MQGDAPTHISSLDAEMDPIRSFLSESEDFTKDHMAIAAAMPSQTSNGEVRVLSMQVPYNKPPDTYSEELKEKLVALMKILYFVNVFPKETLNSANVHVKFLKDLESFAVANDSLFSQSLVAPAQGESSDKVFCCFVAGSTEERSSSSSSWFWVLVTSLSRSRRNRCPDILPMDTTEEWAKHVGCYVRISSRYRSWEKVAQTCINLNLYGAALVA
jgi:hypothetical protein